MASPGESQLAENILYIVVKPRYTAVRTLLN